jgi:hypothetical protein
MVCVVVAADTTVNLAKIWKLGSGTSKYTS